MREAQTAEAQVSGLFEETGLRDNLVQTYTKALLALRDTENAARLRAAGHEEAAALLQPDPALIEAAWGEEPHEVKPAQDIPDGPPPRIRIYIGMASLAGSTQTYELDPQEIPAGWHRMDGLQKEAAMKPIVQHYVDNAVVIGWGEDQ